MQSTNEENMTFDVHLLSDLWYFIVQIHVRWD